MSSPAARRRFPWRWSSLVWLAVPALLWWSLRGIRLTDVWAALARLHPAQILALVALNALTLLAFTARFWFILRAQGLSVPYFALTRYRIAAFGVSYFTPGPQFGGEPVQVYSIARYHGVPGAAAVAATALDKVIELLVNFAVLAAGALVMVETRMFAGLPVENVAGAAAGLFLLLLLPALFLVAAWLGWKPLTWLLGRLPARWQARPAVAAAARSVEAAEAQVSDFCRNRPGGFLLALAATLVSWGFILAEYWLGIAFLGVTLTPAQLIGVMTLNRLAFLVPLPAGLGALESSLVAAFTALGLNPAVGVSHGLIIRARDVGVGLLGLYWAGRLVTKDVGRQTDAAESPAPVARPSSFVSSGESDG